MKKFIALTAMDRTTIYKDVNSITSFYQSGHHVIIDGEIYRNSVEELIELMGAKIIYPESSLVAEDK